MSTEFILFREPDGPGLREVALVERSAHFDLDLDGYPDVGVYEVAGPQQMTAKEAMEMAAGILYAVSCSYPDEVEAFIEEIDGYGLTSTWNAIAKARQA